MPAGVHENNNILACCKQNSMLVSIRKLVMHVLNVTVGKAFIFPGKIREISWYA